MIIEKLIFIKQCLNLFSYTGIRLCLDLLLAGLKIRKKSCVHNLKYNGKRLYYRTNTTDIPLIILILLGTYKRNKRYEQYDFSQMGLPPTMKGVLDLGANIGLFSIKIASRYPNVKIIAVEPELDNYKLLVKNTSFYPNIIPVHAGIWWRNSYLNVRDGGGTGAFWVEESEHGEVKGISIDCLCENEVVQPNIIKMDIEGSEKIVFQHIDNSKWINNVDILIIETHERYVAGSDKIVKDVMRVNGFEESQMCEDIIFRKKT